MDDVLRRERAREIASGVASVSMERTFVFLKPETVMRGLMGEVLSRIERKGLTVIAAKLAQLSREQAERLYEVHRGKHFFDQLVLHVTSGPVLMMILEGPQAVSIMRRLAGATRAAEAEPGTIRGDLAVSTTSNVIHAADSVENAEREASIFFARNEVLTYDKPTEKAYLLKE